MSATVNRLRAPSGNRDADRFQATCPTCRWAGAAHSNRTVEGRRLAERDAAQHRCPSPRPVDIRYGARLAHVRLGGTFRLEQDPTSAVWERSHEPEEYHQVRVTRRDERGRPADTATFHENTVVYPTDKRQVRS